MFPSPSSIFITESVEARPYPLSVAKVELISIYIPILFSPFLMFISLVFITVPIFIDPGVLPPSLLVFAFPAMAAIPIFSRISLFSRPATSPIFILFWFSTTASPPLASIPIFFPLTFLISFGGVPIINLSRVSPPFIFIVPLFIPLCLESALFKLVFLFCTPGLTVDPSSESWSTYSPVSILIPIFFSLNRSLLWGSAFPSIFPRFIVAFCSLVKVSLNVVFKNIPIFPVPATFIVP